MVGITCHPGDKKFGTFCCVVPFVSLLILTWLTIPALTDPICGWEGREGWTWQCLEWGTGGTGTAAPHSSGILKQGMKEKEEGGG